MSPRDTHVIGQHAPTHRIAKNALEPDDACARLTHFGGSFGAGEEDFAGEFDFRDQGRVKGVFGMRVIRSSLLKVRETWDMRISTSEDDAGGGVGVGWVVSSWRLLAGPR